MAYSSLRHVDWGTGMMSEVCVLGIGDEHVLLPAETGRGRSAFEKNHSLTQTRFLYASDSDIPDVRTARDNVSSYRYCTALAFLLCPAITPPRMPIVPMQNCQEL